MKNHATLTSVYILKGNIYYKTVASEKPVCVNNCREINKLELSLSNVKLQDLTLNRTTMQ